MALKLKEGHDFFTLYQCKNGMTDAASPIIIDGQHLAKVFIGQFHLQEPDLEFFRRQARECGFYETDYLGAIQEVPIISAAKFPSILGFLSGFTKMVGSLSMERRRAFKATEAMERRAEEMRRSQTEDAEQARREILGYKEPFVDLSGKKSYAPRPDE